MLVIEHSGPSPLFDESAIEAVLLETGLPLAEGTTARLKEELEYVACEYYWREYSPGDPALQSRGVSFDALADASVTPSRLRNRLIKIERAAKRPGDPLDDPGPLAERSAKQTSKFQAAYGRWLGFLTERGFDGREKSGLDLFYAENVTSFVRRLSADLAPCSVRAYLTELYTVARAMAPDREFEFLRGATRHIWRTARPVTDKRGRLVASRDLYELGFELMTRAETRSTPLQAAGDYRDGFMIALLAARPVRRRNLAAIEIDRQLTREGDRYWLSFPAEEIKTHRPLEFPLPRALTGPMETYLSQYRPFLAARTGRWKNDPGRALWVSGDGSRLKAKRMHERICARTKERFGYPINLHLFRDAAATSIAIEDPAHVGIILAILGHSVIRTSETYYNQASGIEAARHYQDVIAAFH